MKKTILLLTGLAFLTLRNEAQTTVTDIDGNVYNTVTIGTQVWMKENLKVTHYRNGIQIPIVTNGTTWGTRASGARCYYNNDSVTNAPVYGTLYNWYAVSDSSNLCPTGWHVPSDAEWNIMEKYLDNTVDTTVSSNWIGTDIGNKLKESGTSHWTSGNNGTNSSGFTALPGGCRNISAFDVIGNFGYWWSATAYDASHAWYRNLFYLIPEVGRYYELYGEGKVDGFSVRCVRDLLSTKINDKNIENHIQIYPNPAIDKVFIYCSEKQNLKMQVYNIIGECVLQSELTNGTNTIDISSLTSGIYVIRLTGADRTFQQKLIKE